MKQVHGVARIRNDKYMNILALQMVEKDRSREWAMSEISKHYGKIPEKQRESMLNSVMQRCYRRALDAGSGLSVKAFKNYSVPDEDFLARECMGGCFAVRLCDRLMGFLCSGGFRADSENRFGEEYYDTCARELERSDLSAEAGDPELLIIYVKQIMVMLKAAGLLDKQGAAPVLAGNRPRGSSLYLALFSSFWHKVEWEEIFPSMPHVARELKRCRSFLVDIILRKPDVFSLDSVVDEFFDLTGFGRKGDLYLVSFIDFYFFTWLKHFALVRYMDGLENAPVRLGLTGFGRSFLARL